MLKLLSHSLIKTEQYTNPQSPHYKHIFKIFLLLCVLQSCQVCVWRHLRSQERRKSSSTSVSPARFRPLQSCPERSWWICCSPRIRVATEFPWASESRTQRWITVRSSDILKYLKYSNISHFTFTQLAFFNAVLTQYDLRRSEATKVLENKGSSV